MGKMSRQNPQSIRHRYPLPAERHELPRTDCRYVGDGFGEETGTWSVEKRAVYFICSVEGGSERLELELVAQEPVST